MLDNLRRWLSGEFTCTRCGRTYHTMSFGYGSAICPDCYRGEPRFLQYDGSYWLNRLLIKLQKQPTKLKQPHIAMPDQKLKLIKA